MGDHRNKLAVALANKPARIAWSVRRTDKAFDSHYADALGELAGATPKNWALPSLLLSRLALSC
jgi:hypothetical protein